MATTSQSTPILKEVLKDKIAGVLRAWILDGTLKPGERVIELAVAAQLGVSRAPLREALMILEREGLVRISAHQGAHVMRMSVEDIREIFEIREALETLAAKRIRARLTPESRAQLNAALEALEGAARAKEMSKFREADLAFHATLWELAGNRHLTELLGGISSRLFGYKLIRDMPHSKVFRFAAIAREHRELVRLILEEDDAAIEIGFRKCFQTFLDYVLERFGDV